MNVTSVMVLGAGRLQVPAIRHARLMGFRVVAVDADGNAPGLAEADVACVADISNPETCLTIARSQGVKGVVHICSEVAMHTLGAINDALGLHGVGYDAAVRCTNKAAMRRAFASCSKYSLRSFEVRGVADARRVIGAIGLPAIVKPSRNSGSRGVVRIDRANFQDLDSVVESAVQLSRDHTAIVEEYFDGREYSVEMMVWNRVAHVIAVTDKATTGAPNFVEIGHSQPSTVSGDEYGLVCEAAIQGVAALDVDWTAAHAEVKIDAGEARIMEIGARLGGDFITTELVPRSTGVNMVRGAINLSLGIAPDVVRPYSRGAAIRYLVPKPGTVTAIEGVDFARRCKYVADLEVYVSIGSRVESCVSSLARAGHVIAEGEGSVEAVRAAEEAAALVVIKTDPF